MGRLAEWGDAEAGEDENCCDGGLSRFAAGLREGVPEEGFGGRTCDVLAEEGEEEAVEEGGEATEGERDFSGVETAPFAPEASNLALADIGPDDAIEEADSDEFPA